LAIKDIVAEIFNGKNNENWLVHNKTQMCEYVVLQLRKECNSLCMLTWQSGRNCVMTLIRLSKYHVLTTVACLNNFCDHQIITNCYAIQNIWLSKSTLIQTYT